MYCGKIQTAKTKWFFHKTNQLQARGRPSTIVSAGNDSKRRSTINATNKCVCRLVDSKKNEKSKCSFGQSKSPSSMGCDSCNREICATPTKDKLYRHMTNAQLQHIYSNKYKHINYMCLTTRRKCAAFSLDIQKMHFHKQLVLTGKCRKQIVRELSYQFFDRSNNDLSNSPSSSKIHK